MKDAKRYVLSDYLREGLRIVFVGTAVGDASARKQHYYSGANNAFWPIIYEAGIVSTRLGPEDDTRVNDFGIGLTDLVKDIHTSDDTLLPADTLRDGTVSLVEKITLYAPKVVCFTGKNASKAFAGPKAGSFGFMSDNIGTSLVFVVPSTSGRVSQSQKFDGKTRREWFETLAELAKLGPIDSVEGSTHEAKERTAVKSRPNGQERVMLHDEIALILQANGKRWMTTRELADEVNRRGRYLKKDGSEVTPYQVHGRTRQYSHMFERDGSRVRLKSP